VALDVELTVVLAEVGVVEEAVVVEDVDWDVLDDSAAELLVPTVELGGLIEPVDEVGVVVPLDEGADARKYATPATATINIRTPTIITRLIALFRGFNNGRITLDEILGTVP